MAEGTGPIDLGRMRGDDPRDRPGVPQEQPQTFYVNDVQPSVQNDGTLTLTFAYQGAWGTSPGVAVTMPLALFVEVAMLVPQMLPDGIARIETYRDRLATALSGARERADASRRGGPPSPIR